MTQHNANHNTSLSRLSDIVQTLDAITTLCHSNHSSTHVTYLNEELIHRINDLINTSDASLKSINTSSCIQDICFAIEYPNYSVKKRHKQTQSLLNQLEKINSQRELQQLFHQNKELLGNPDTLHMSKAEREIYLANKKQQLHRYLMHLNDAKKLNRKQLLLHIIDAFTNLIYISINLLFSTNNKQSDSNTQHSRELEKIQILTLPTLIKKGSSYLSIEDLITQEINQGGSVFETYLYTIAHELNINWQRYGLQVELHESYIHKDQDTLTP